MSTFACPICGNINRIGAKFCGRCGNALPAPQFDIGRETGRLGANSLIRDRYVIVRGLGPAGMGPGYLAVSYTPPTLPTRDLADVSVGTVS